MEIFDVGEFDPQDRQPQKTRAEKLYALAARAHDIATASGFDAPTWENFPDKLMFVVSEVSELEQSRVSGPTPLSLTGNPDSLAELADVAIRTMAILHGLFGSWNARGHAFEAGRGFGFDMLQVTPERWELQMIGLLSRALEAWRHDRRADALYACEALIDLLFRVAEISSSGRVDRVSLLFSIEEKIAKNATRPRLHGKVMSLG